MDRDTQIFYTDFFTYKIIYDNLNSELIAFEGY